MCSVENVIATWNLLSLTHLHGSQRFGLQTVIGSGCFVGTERGMFLRGSELWDMWEITHSSCRC